MNLARELYSTDVAHDAAVIKVERLLTALFIGWQSWEHIKPYGIAVFGALESPTAAARLHAVGFETVILHDHLASERLGTCHCKIFDDP